MSDGLIEFDGVSPRARLIATLWQGREPFLNFTPSTPPDLQGWSGSRDPWLEQAVLALRPRIIVEIGVWKGASTLFMAETMRSHGIPGVVVAVDTWLGSVEHWRNPDWFASLRITEGRSGLQQTFMANVVAADLQDYVLPLPLDSVNAAELLHAVRLQADLIHLDAGHDERSVGNDLQAWWEILRPGGQLIGDDYYPTGDLWPGVRKAFDRFCAEHAVPHQVKAPKICLTRPLADAALPPTAGSAVARAASIDVANLPETLEYVGEFGPELVLFLPFMTWLAREGALRNRRIVTYRGMRCFYEDLDCAELIEKPGARSYVPPQQRSDWLPVKNEHDFDTRQASPRHLCPDLRTRFRVMKLSREIGSQARPLLIIHNKYANEWGEGPINHIPIATLDTIFRVLKHEFTIVYIRHGMAPPEGGFVEDHNETLPGFDDRDLLQRHPEVLGFDELFAEHRAATGDDDLNRFKTMLLARCHRFISCQGGGAHQISLLNGSLFIVLHRRGSEEHWAYSTGYYSFLAKVPPMLAVCRNDDELIRAIPLFIGSFMAHDRCLPAPGAAPILAALSPATISQR